MGWGEQSGRAMTDAEIKAAGFVQRGTIGPDTASASAKVGDPDTTLGGDPFVQTEPEAAEVEELTLEPTDVFEVVVRYAQDRAYDTSPTFDSYDEAREVGIDLLKNHADARSFSITKSTVLR